MTLSRYVTVARIRTGVALNAQSDVFRLIANIIASDIGVEESALEEALLAREKLGSTAIGKGVALPHAKTAAVNTAAAAIIVLEKPLEYSAPDDVPVDLFIAFLAPQEGSDLSILAGIAKDLRNDAVLRSIRTAGTPTDILSVLNTTHDLG